MKDRKEKVMLKLAGPNRGDCLKHLVMMMIMTVSGTCRCVKQRESRSASPVDQLC